MCQYLRDELRLLDAGNDFEPPTATRAAIDLDAKGKGRGSGAPEGLLVAEFAGQGLVNGDSGLRGCLHKPSYTN